MNSRAVLAVGILLLILPVRTRAEGVHTPQPGSAQRKAICCDVRAYVLKQYAVAPLPRPIVFRIERLAVQGRYCSFQAIPLFEDGSYVSPEYVTDIVFDLCLEKSESGWQVVYDFSRTDVPDEVEIRELKQSFPKDFPAVLIPDFWRKLFEETH
jgi:hypothetical protein